MVMRSGGLEGMSSPILRFAGRKGSNNAQGNLGEGVPHVFTLLLANCVLPTPSIPVVITTVRWSMRSAARVRSSASRPTKRSLRAYGMRWGVGSAPGSGTVPRGKVANSARAQINERKRFGLLMPSTRRPRRAIVLERSKTTVRLGARL